MKILGVGEAVVDRNIKHNNERYDAGGPVLAALTLLARSGIECEFVASVGPDAGGRFIKELLSKEKVNLVEHQRQATKQNTIIVHPISGQRTKIPGQTKHAPIQGLNPDYIRSFDMIVVDRHEPKAFYEIAQHARPNQPVIIDPSTEVSNFTKDMMEFASHPIIPIEALAKIENSFTQALRACYDICRKPFIVTLGDLGSLIYDRQDISLIPPLEVTVVDTLGAGDIYRGAIGYGLLQGWGLAKCAEYANAAAALQCTRRGNARAAPTPETIFALLMTGQKQDVTMPDVESSFKKLVKQSEPKVLV